jgi:hypothetical protein
MAILAFFHWPKASESGALEPVPSSFIFWKAGLSCSCSRIQTEMPSSTIESRKGMRQPQSAKAASPMRRAGEEDHQQREEEAQRGRGLDPARVEAAPALR